MPELTGVGVSPGTGSGPVRRFVEVSLPSPAQAVPHGDPHLERARALAALEAVAVDLEMRARHATRPEARDVLNAQSMMVRDPGLIGGVSGRAMEGATAAVAIGRSFQIYRDVLAVTGGYLAARVADLNDLRDRAVARLYRLPMPGIPVSDEPFVLVARDLAPADTALLDPAQVLAIVTEQGGPTSHTAILARSLGIPAVVGCPGAASIAEGTIALVDGASGVVRLDPSSSDVERVRRAAASRATAAGAVTGKGMTSDGHPVPLFANIGGPGELAAALAHGAEGVGLYRTELLFLDRAKAPSQEEQRDVYREVLEAFPAGRVVVRVLDAGGDKPLTFLPAPGAEPNPGLGERGLRLLRRYPEILTAQLAALASAARGLPVKLQVMAPMVTDVADAEYFVKACRKAGIANAGIMIEVPAAALRARDLASAVDFFSIGTNDLTQYACAADREVGALARLLDPWQPAVLDLVGIAGHAAHEAGMACGVCGEAAADPALACVLAGLGATSLSMNAPALPLVRAALAAHTMDECRHAAKTARAAASAAEARAAAREHLHGLRDMGL